MHLVTLKSHYHEVGEGSNLKNQAGSEALNITNTASEV